MRRYQRLKLKSGAGLTKNENLLLLPNSDRYIDLHNGAVIVGTSILGLWKQTSSSADVKLKFSELSSMLDGNASPFISQVLGIDLFGLKVCGNEAVQMV